MDEVNVLDLPQSYAVPFHTQMNTEDSRYVSRN